MVKKRHFPWYKHISHIFEYVLILLFSSLFNLIPYRALNTTAIILNFLFYPLLKGSRKRILANLKKAFPEKTDIEIKNICKKNIIHTLRIFLEVFQMRKFKNKKFADKYLITETPEFFNEFIRRGEAVIIVQGHYGNWELPIPYALHRNINIAYVVKRMSNPLVNNLLLNRRKKNGGVLLFMEDSAEIFKYIKKKYAIGLAADQDAGPGGVFVPFMGRPASTFPGPALLSYMTETKLVLGSSIYAGKGKYKISARYLKKINKKDYKNRKEAILEITKMWTAELEKEIKKNPEQYFWIHRRWKSSPPDDR